MSEVGHLSNGSRQFWIATDGYDQETELLMITEGDQAGSYSKLWGEMSEVGHLSNGSRQLPVWRSSTGYSLIQCPAGLHAAEIVSLARAVLSTASNTATVLVLASRHVSELKSDETNYPTTPVYSLVTKSWAGTSPCPSLPQPNIVSGLPAAVLTMAQMSGQKAALVVAYNEVLVVDSLTLAPFSVCHKLDVVTKAGIKKVMNIGEELSKLKLKNSDDSLYM